MKHCSIIIVHFAQVDGFKEDRIKETDVRSKILRQCLDSLEDNTDYPSEIIVIDNGGNPDDTDYLVQKVRDGVINTLIRNKENMGFAYAWNQGIRLATGDYFCFTCNDIVFKKGWLTKCIELLEKYPDRKFLATPFIERSKDNARYNKEILDGNRVNSLAGSNCIIMDYKTFVDVGEFPQHRVGGSIWHRRMTRMDYQVICPPENLIEHIGQYVGVNFRKQFIINKTFLKREFINFNYKYENPHEDYYFGKQKRAGCPLQQNYLRVRKTIQGISE